MTFDRHQKDRVRHGARGAGHTFGSSPNLLLDAQPEKPRPLLGDNKGM